MSHHIGRPLAAWGIVGLVMILTSLTRAEPVSAELPPGHAVDQKEVCLQCHDLEQDLQAKVPHAPVVSGDCTSCHNPHVARFANLLRERPGPLCEECHSELAQERKKASVHRPVAEGRCADCHNPHGSDYKGLLKQPRIRLCESCHSQIAAWRSRPVQHPPFAQQQCGSCHEPHAADADGLLKAEGARVCSGCHSQGAQFRSAHRGYPVERAACQTCHDPHASGKPGLFRETVHPPFDSGDCETCHASPGAADPFKLKMSEEELCGSCHDGQVDDSLEAPFPHVSGGGDRCTACHNPHAGQGAGMLIKELNQTCLTCHDPGGAKSGLEGRYSTHAEDLECVICHSPHGGTRPLLFDQDPIEVCGDCHTHEHGVRHPIGEDTVDPRTGSPMDCGSCHGIHLAPYDKYMHASPSGDLCLGCHREIGGRRR